MAAETESKETTKQIVCEPAIIKAPQMSSWNDSRLDELSGRIDQRFEKVDQEFKSVRQEMRDGFAQVDKRFEKVEGEMKAGFEKVDKDMKEGFARIDRLTNTLLGGTLAVIAAGAGVIASVLLAGIFG